MEYVVYNYHKKDVILNTSSLAKAQRFAALLSNCTVLDGVLFYKRGMLVPAI